MINDRRRLSLLPCYPVRYFVTSSLSCFDFTMILRLSVYRVYNLYNSVGNNSMLLGNYGQSGGIKTGLYFHSWFSSPLFSSAE